jgi:hypothetical protein
VTNNYGPSLVAIHKSIVKSPPRSPLQTIVQPGTVSSTKKLFEHKAASPQQRPDKLAPSANSSPKIATEEIKPVSSKADRDLKSTAVKSSSKKAGHRLIDTVAYSSSGPSSVTKIGGSAFKSEAAKEQALERKARLAALMRAKAQVCLSCSVLLRHYDLT